MLDSRLQARGKTGGPSVGLYRLMNAKMRGALISLIVPTRGRPSQMLSFLKSVHETAASPDDIEIVVVVDDDDDTSDLIVFDGIRMIRVVVPAGLTMGELNTAGYKASNGSYIMLCNDDITVKTPGWDNYCVEVFRSFPDEIVLAHVNDAMFEKDLCIFPFVSRKFCEIAKGICDKNYIRYCIDDHIYNIFIQLSFLGHKRIVYLPRVVFEHLNFEVDEDGKARYVANPDIHKKDVETFERNLQSRKDLAVRFACLIDEYRRKNAENSYICSLAFQSDFDGISNLVQTRAVGQLPSTFATIFSLTTRRQRRSTNTRHKEYRMICEHENLQDLNLARELNQIISVCKTDYIVLNCGFDNLSDRCIDDLLLCMAPDVAIAAPVVFDADRSLLYAGGTLSPENNGVHGPSVRIPEVVTPVQTVLASIIVVDLNKVGHLRFDENFSDSFLYLDYCLQVWEAGFQVVVSPNCRCTKGRSAISIQDLEEKIAAFSIEQANWEKKWVSTARLNRIIESVWSEIAHFRGNISFKSDLCNLIYDNSRRASDHKFVGLVESIGSLIKYDPVLRDYTRRQIRKVLREASEDDIRDRLRGLLIQLKVEKFDSKQLKGIDALWFMPWQLEREFSKLLCTLGIKKRGETFWNNSFIREKIEAGEMSLFGDSKLGSEGIDSA